MKKHGRGLGKLQIMQRKHTEHRILEHLNDVEKQVTRRSGEKILQTKWAWVRTIQNSTRIERKTLIKTLNRMVREGKILEIRGNRNSRFFCLPGSANAKLIRYPHRSNYKNKLKANRYWRRREQELKRKRFMWDPRQRILESIIKIEEDGKNETEVLNEIGVSHRGYESWIKRSPRLSFIRQKLRENKKNGIVMPSKWRRCPPLWLKRYMINGDDVMRFFL